LLKLAKGSSKDEKESKDPAAVRRRGKR
jgi:hypothetical protein